MLIDATHVQATVERFERRTEARERNRRTLASGGLLRADTPERVAKRVARLAREHGPARADAEATPGVLLERLIGENDLMGVSYLGVGRAAARTVGRVHVRSAPSRPSGFGTGFLVAPDLVLTNNHVLADAGLAAASLIEFDYEDGPDGAPLDAFTVRFDPARLFLTDAALDFTLVALADPEGRLAERGWNPLIEAEGKIIVGESLTIVQHARGEPKQIALRRNRLLDVLEDHLHYETDTAPGSSGSPVYNDAWEVVALHHSGVPRRDAQGRFLTRDGRVWTDALDDSLIDWIANEGVRASRIAARVRSAPMDAAQARLCEPMFASRLPFVEADEARRPPSAAPRLGYADDGTGAAQWTIPLYVSVRVGGSAALAPAPAPRGSAPAPAPKPAPPRAEPADEDPELRAALRAAREAAGRPYYDEAGDRAAQQDYYASADADLAEATPRRRYELLHGLVERTHTTRPSYKPALRLYPWVERREDLRIRSVYSHTTFDVDELIREDFRIDAQRRELSEVWLREGSETSRGAAEIAAALEATLPYNCEHSVPQSWFGKKEPMKGDLHHLFACEINCNSFRGNMPYFDFEDFGEALRDACGKRETNRFEPEQGKGAVARATLYFLLRYPGEINRTAAEYTPDRIETLLRWHEAQPPDRYERHRNQAIFEIQGNRNPLIDRPDLARRVDFTAGLG